MPKHDNDQARRVTTPVAILSYPHLFEPTTGPQGGKPKYSCALVFEKGADLSEMKEALIAAGEEKWGDKFRDMVRAGKVRLPFRDDAEAKGYPEGSTFFNCRTEQKPGLVGRERDPETGYARRITDPVELYPGCRVRASVVAFAYDTSGNRGVSFALGNIQKWADGDRLDSRRAAEDEFEADLAPISAADVDDLI